MIEFPRRVNGNCSAGLGPDALGRAAVCYTVMPVLDTGSDSVQIQTLVYKMMSWICRNECLEHVNAFDSSTNCEPYSKLMSSEEAAVQAAR